MQTRICMLMCALCRFLIFGYPKQYPQQTPQHFRAFEYHNFHRLPPKKNRMPFRKE
jgi:hypothetical protein